MVLLSAAAIASTAMGARRSWLDFEFEGMVFLLAAAAESGLLTFLAGALGGVPSGGPPLAAALIAGCAVLCYAAATAVPQLLYPGPQSPSGFFIEKKPPCKTPDRAPELWNRSKPVVGEPWKSQVLHLAVAALAVGSAAALLVQGMVALTALKVIPGAHHVAFIRTLVLCSAALTLVFGGARWQRRELTRIGYATLVLVAVKLVAEDLRHGHLAYIAGSIFLFALTLIAAPRVARAQQRV
jgi:hypothetical protein